MMQKKKLVMIGALATVVIVGGTLVAGVAMAQTSNYETTTNTVVMADNPASGNNTMMARVAKILGIDQQKLTDAFTQASKEERQAALDNYLKAQVTAGKITQAQADQYKAWANSQPQMPAGFGKPGMMQGREGGMMRGGRPGMMGKAPAFNMPARPGYPARPGTPPATGNTTQPK